ncbi:MAG: hypothetical protein RDV41_00020 [Planctomycetota bacterium]|nr:hypothetical protein [Planctomycetota bacterium]
MTKKTLTKLLVTVMTYPHPSTAYQELVCAAGITEECQWVRLYPVDYRYRPRKQRFHKYQWVEVELEDRGEGNDNRKESRRPSLDTLRVLGEPLSTEDGWRARREVIDRVPHRTLNELKALYDSDRTSLGIVRPSKVLDLEIAPAEQDWKPEWQELFLQLRLFGESQKPLRKLPFEFRFVFECPDSDKPHTATILDWELGVLFLKESERLQSDDEAAKSVKRKYMEEMCSPERDTRFFMGTRFPFNAWMVLGVFWPPKTYQRAIF